MISAFTDSFICILMHVKVLVNAEIILPRFRFSVVKTESPLNYNGIEIYIFL